MSIHTDPTGQNTDKRPRLPKIDEVMAMSGELDRHLVDEALAALARAVQRGELEAYTAAGSNNTRWNVWDNTLQVRLTLGSWVRIWCAAERQERDFAAMEIGPRLTP